MISLLHTIYEERDNATRYTANQTTYSACAPLQRSNFFVHQSHALISTVRTVTKVRDIISDYLRTISSLIRIIVPLIGHHHSLVIQQRSLVLVELMRMDCSPTIHHNHILWSLWIWIPTHLLLKELGIYLWHWCHILLLRVNLWVDWLLKLVVHWLIVVDLGLHIRWSVHISCRNLPIIVVIITSFHIYKLMKI